MKFIMVRPALRTRRSVPNIELLYIAEEPVKIGDYVEAQVYASPQYHEVLRVGSTRAAVKAGYGGPVKSIDRVLSAREARAIERVERAEGAVERAYAALHKVAAAVTL